jgi:hypothetical protein
MASRERMTTYKPKAEATNDQIERGEPDHILFREVWWAWVYVVRRSLIGLLHQPRMMCMEHLVEWELAGETEVLEENLP